VVIPLYKTKTMWNGKLCSAGCPIASNRIELINPDVHSGDYGAANRKSVSDALYPTSTEPRVNATPSLSWVCESVGEQHDERTRSGWFDRRDGKEVVTS
jgi:hypothetical protein